MGLLVIDYAVDAGFWMLVSRFWHVVMEIIKLLIIGWMLVSRFWHVVMGLLVIDY